MSKDRKSLLAFSQLVSQILNVVVMHSSYDAARGFETI